MFGVYDVVVVGAGPAGSVLATALARASFRVALLEEYLQMYNQQVVDTQVKKTELN